MGYSQRGGRVRHNGAHTHTRLILLDAITKTVDITQDQIDNVNREMGAIRKHTWQWKNKKQSDRDAECLQ